MGFSKMPNKADESLNMEAQLKKMNEVNLADPFFGTGVSNSKKEVKKRGPRGSVYTERVSTYLTKEMAGMLEEYCKANGITPATAGRLAFRNLLSGYMKTD